MKTLCPAIILARGGSKAIPGKNLLNFAGRPLFEWSILQARKSQMVDAVFVSSDDDEILDVAANAGAQTIKRPDEFSTDTATSEVALIHTLDVIKDKQGHDPEKIVFLQPTSPLREASDIDGAVSVFSSAKVDSLFSCAMLDDFTVWGEEDGQMVGKTFDPWNRGRRQDRKPLYLENGSIYVFKPKLLRKTGNRLGGEISIFPMPFWKSHEIDNLEEVELCEFYFKQHLLLDWHAHLSPIPRTEIQLIVYDFDGVMTNNQALQFQDGTEGVFVNRGDGWGIARLRDQNIPQIILSTEKNTVVAARGKKLKIDVIHGCDDKKAALKDYCERLQIDLSAVLYVGNDVNDLEVMKIVGFPIAPADAHPSVITIARLVTSARGGEGVIKELSEHILVQK